MHKKEELEKNYRASDKGRILILAEVRSNDRLIINYSVLENEGTTPAEHIGRLTLDGETTGVVYEGVNRRGLEKARELFDRRKSERIDRVVYSIDNELLDEEDY